MDIDSRIEELKQISRNKRKGIFTIHTPLAALPALDRFLGGLQRGTVVGITAEPNVGKTPLCKSFLYSLYIAKQLNPKIKFKALFFALEESKEDFIDTLIISFYYLKHHKYIEYKQLVSTSINDVPDSFWDHIDELRNDLHAFFEDIVLIDNLYDPDEIYEFCHEGILKRGMMDGSRYVPYDPEIHYVCFVDNCNLFRASGSEKHTLMEKWVSNYAAAKLAKQYKWTVVNVLQQTLDSDKEQYTRSGASIVKKLEPSLYRLGNNKEISRDHHVMIGMFAPSFYGVDEYHKYKIDDFRHSFRCLSILKNRRGAPRGHIDCLLKHNTFFFEELPHPEKEPERLAEVLREFRRLQGGDNTY